jgi:hypothetical protein
LQKELELAQGYDRDAPAVQPGPPRGRGSKTRGDDGYKLEGASGAADEERAPQVSQHGIVAQDRREDWHQGLRWGDAV